MPNISKLFTSVNLIYYEYDRSLKTFIVDQQFKKESSMELVSITNLLQQHNLTYTIDTRSNVHISHQNSILANISNTIGEHFKSLIHKKHNIYILSDKKVENAQNLSVITTKVIPSEIDFSQYDVLVFTSKNAVASLDSFNKEWREKPSYAIAPQTAKIIKKFKGQLRYVGKNHHGDEFANELVEELKDKRVLYIRAKEVVSNFSKILNTAGILCDEAIVYETVCKTQLSRTTLPKDSIIIFSSPSTIECFFLHREWDKTYTAVAIGKTTAKYLPSFISPHIAESTSIESCIREALKIESK